MLKFTVCVYILRCYHIETLSMLIFREVDMRGAIKDF